MEGTQGRDRRAYGDLQQIGGARLVTLEDGPERGVRVIEFRTSTGIELGVIVDRALDLGWCRHHGRSVAWHSPTGFVGPWYREPQGLGFLRSFPGGLTVTCGLDHILFPESDPADTYNYPGRNETEYGLHGRISNTPARLTSYGERWHGERCVLHAEGEVRQAGGLAENLVLRRRVELDIDGHTIRWRDQVTNEGHLPAPHMLLYHINLGAPLLDPSSELHAPIREVLFATPTATGGEGEHLRFHEPRADFVEQAFSHAMQPASDGRVPVMLLNRRDPARPWGVVLRYDAERFPYFFQWRYLAAGNYVTGLEPSTNDLLGRKEERAQGRLTLLEPGESRAYENEIELVDGSDRCGEVAEEIAALTADRAVK